MLGGGVSKEDVLDHILHDEDLVSKWNVLSGHLSHDNARLLLMEIIDLWLTICSHAFAKKANNGRTQAGQERINKEKCSIEETNVVIREFVVFCILISLRTLLLCMCHFLSLRWEGGMVNLWLCCS